MKKRTGAASFYIVAFSTLLLTVIAIAFTTSILSETNRTIDDDLSQSAYDSALAGIEDAKLAIAKYNDCKVNSASNKDCKSVIDLFEHHKDDCDVVAKILGRINEGAEAPDGTFIKETSGNSSDDNGMEQAYTCVTLETKMYDYRATLTPEHLTHVVSLSVDNADAVKSIRISWYSDTDGTTLVHKDVTSNGLLKYPKLTSSQQSSAPPTIAVELIQTPSTFTMDDLDNGTNRGILYLTPSNRQLGNANDKDDAPKYLLTETSSGKPAIASTLFNADYYDITNTYNNGNDYKTNVLREEQGKMNFTQSNRNSTKNIPILVYCPENSGSEFACSASIEVPRPTPADAKRNQDTFMLAVSLPYGHPDTDFAIEVCTDKECYPMSENGTKDESHHVPFNNSQIKIDSTGRANDLYRRVEARVENIDPYFPTPTYAVQLDGSNASMVKSLYSSTKSGTNRKGENPTP